jgi:hypothetical protein
VIAIALQSCQYVPNDKVKKMKTRIVPAIHVALQPSYLILGCYVFVSILSLLSVLQTSFSILLKCVIVCAVIIATIYTILQDVLLTLPWSWKLVEVTSQGKVRVHNQRGELFEVVPLASSVSHPWLTILRFKRLTYQHGWRNSLMLAAWQVRDPQQFRKLRVWLNWGRADKKHQPLVDVALPE